jgi:hypothetical protein
MSQVVGHIVQTDQNLGRLFQSVAAEACQSLYWAVFYRCSSRMDHLAVFPALHGCRTVFASRRIEYHVGCLCLANLYLSRGLDSSRGMRQAARGLCTLRLPCSCSCTLSQEAAVSCVWFA